MKWFVQQSKSHPLLWCFLWVGITIQGCERPIKSSIPLPNPGAETQMRELIGLDSAAIHDRLLGGMIGSAIGDAMGAPVEMWTRSQIEGRYGFIDRVLPNFRVASAEGPWTSNSPAGIGTDDTRWKHLYGQFLLSQQRYTDDPKAFAEFIVNEYDQLRKKLNATDLLAASKLESSIRYLQWLQEWVKVAEAYLSGSIDQYADALAKFYGGEMSCAGMLYAPSIGMMYPGLPGQAYKTGWKNSIFDLGYAKDITAMTTSLVSAAFTTPVDSLLELHIWLDPEQYSDSRLIGRISQSIHEEAILLSNTFAPDTTELKAIDVPVYFEGNKVKYFRMQHFFRALDEHTKSVAFHAEEIYRIAIYSLAFAGNDFKDAMVFITNYGRDNDTVAAVVGAILGVRLGYSGLPGDWKQQVVTVNNEQLNIDLVELADALVDKFWLSQ